MPDTTLAEALKRGTCTIVTDYDWAASGPLPDDLATCGQPVIAFVTFACVHEHLDGAVACAGCAAELQQIADSLGCRSCDNGPRAHSCPVTIQIHWLSGEVTHA